MPASKKFVIIAVLVVLTMVSSSVGTVFLIEKSTKSIVKNFENPITVWHVSESESTHVENSEITDQSSTLKSGGKKLNFAGGDKTSTDGDQIIEPLAASWGDWSYRDAHNVPAAANDFNLAGNGVVVALVDTGIDFGVQDLSGKYKIENRIYTVSNEIIVSSSLAEQYYVINEQLSVTDGVDASVKRENLPVIEATLRIWVNGTETTNFTIDLTQGEVYFSPALQTGAVVNCSYRYYAKLKNYNLMDNTLRIWINGNETTSFAVDTINGYVDLLTPLAVGSSVNCSYIYYSPYYGWPMAFDPYALGPYVQAGEVAEGYGGFVNTSKNGTGPFPVDHEIEIDGKNDFSTTEKVGQDPLDDVKEPSTNNWEYDLYDLYATRDEKYWYFGIPTQYAGINRTFGFAIDMDNETSGGLTDPEGNYIDFETSHTSPIEHLAFDPNSGRVASCAGAGYPDASKKTTSPEVNMIKVWSSTGDLLYTSPKEEYPIHSVAWTPDGSMIAYCTYTDLVVLYASNMTEMVRIKHTPTYGAINPLSFNTIEAISIKPPYGSELAVGSYIFNGDSLGVLNLTTKNWMTVNIADQPRSVAYNVDGSKVAVGLKTDGNIKILETTGYTTIKTLSSPMPNPVECVAWSPDGTHLAVSQDIIPAITIWDTTTDTVVGSLSGGHSAGTTINSIKWINGQIITAGNDGKIIIWNDVSFSPVVVRSSRYSKPVWCIDINQTSNELFVGTDDCSVRKYASDWSGYVPFVAHKPDTIVYIQYEREYYKMDPVQEIIQADKIQVPIVYKWNVTTMNWEKTNLSAISGSSSYKGLLAGAFTEKGFIEWSIPRDFIGWNNSNKLYVSVFTVGDQKSRAQDSVPSDCNVPTPSSGAVFTDFVSTNVVGIGSYALVQIAETTINASAIVNKSSFYHFGYHPSKALTKALGPIALIVTDSQVQGQFDRVYIDMNADHVIDNKDVWVDRDHPNALLDWYNISQHNSMANPSPDGIPDISGGLLYFIGDGRTPIPYSSRMAEELDVIVDADNPLPIPGKGELLAFFGEFDYDDYEGMVETHGTMMASAIAANGVSNGEFGPMLGVSPNITFLPICNAQYDLANSLYFAVDGYDGEPNTGDEADIVAIGQFTSDYNNGLDTITQLVEYLAKEYTKGKMTFISPAGNDGSGYGTIGSPCGPSTIVVGRALDNTFSKENSGANHHFGDVAELSARGPTAAGLGKPDVIAVGSGEVVLPLGEATGMVGGANSSRNVWASTELSCAVATGIMALTFEAFYKSNHQAVNENVIQGATTNMTMVTLKHYPVVGVPTITKNGDTMTSTEFDLYADNGTIVFFQNITKGDWVNASYTYTNEYPDTQTAIELLTSSAKDLKYESFTQGHGYIDAYSAALLASESSGIRASASSESFGSTFGECYSGFVNTLPPGGSDTITIEFSNLGAGEEDVTYSFESYERLSAFSYNFVMVGGSSEKYQRDISTLIQSNADFVKITAQTEYDGFKTKSGDYTLSLYDWVDIPSSSGASIGKINLLTPIYDDASFISSTTYFNKQGQPESTLANALTCTISNPHKNMKGSLLVELKPARPSVTLTNRVWTMTVESFAAVNWTWGDLSKTTSTIAADGKDTLSATVNVPSDAYPGTYGASVVACYDKKSTTENQTIAYQYDLASYSYELAVKGGRTVNEISDLLNISGEYQNNTVDIYSIDVKFNNSPLVANVDYSTDYDTGHILFTPPLVGESDGIGDLLYEIDADSQDTYPLMAPFTFETSLTQRLPVRINSDAEFASMALAESWQGNGSSENPYIIENYDINGTGYGYCIYIGNTTVRFVIRNCSLHNAGGVGSSPYYSDTGLILYNVQYGLIYHNNIFDNTHQAYDDTAFNIWNDVYPSCGNYWDDYDGQDEYFGPSQYQSAKIEISYKLNKVIDRIPLLNNNVIDILDMTIIRENLDGGFTSVPYTVNRALGLVELLNKTAGRNIIIYTNYTYYNRTVIIPVTLNVYASDVAKFEFGNMTATENPGPMPVWALRPGCGSTLKSGDRRYYYINIPDQGLFTTLSNFYLYTEAIWGLNHTDINIYVYGEDTAGISSNIAPYTLKKLGSSEDWGNFSFNTVTNGPKEIQITPFSTKLVVICVAAKSFNGTGDCYEKFQARGGWVNIDNQKKYTNSLAGHMTLSSHSNIEFSSGISASIVGPAQGVKTTEEVYKDNVDYDLTLEGWLSINANAQFQRVVKVENALSWDVHIMGDATAIDLDLSVFLDGHNGGAKDGKAQWMEIVTQDVCKFEAYKSTYGTGRYCYCADGDADEALKLINPPNGDYIITVLGYTVSASPGHFDMELKTIFAGVPGYELQAWQKEYGNENQNESIKNLFVNKTPVLPFELRSFNVTWSFKEGTKDDSYGGIYVFGIPDAEKLIVLSVDIILDTKPMNITPSYTGPNSIVNTKTPVISADIADIERGEIKPDGTSVWLDGEDVSGLSQISIAITQNSKLQDGYWMGTVELTPTALAEGGHEITIISEDFTGNLAEESWAFTVDTKAPEPVTWLDEVTYTNQDIFELRGTSETDATVSALLGATPVEVKRDTVGAFWANLNLEDGSNQVLLTAADAAGNAARQILTIIKDTEAPTFEKLICQAGTLTNRQNTVLSGKMSEAGTLTINGDPTSINNDGTFDKFIVLSGGTNTYGLQFTDLAGNNVARWFNVTLDTQAPAITVKDHESTVKEQDFNLTGTTEASATLKVNGKLVQVGSGGGFNKLLQLSPGQNAIVIESKDAAGNVNQVYLTIAYDATGTNFGAIGLMVVLLVLGLLLGILFSKYLPWFGAKPEAAGEVKEGEEIKAEEGVEPEEEKESPEPEEGEEAGAEPEVPEEVEETKEPEAEAEPIPKEEGLPKELPSEDEKVAKIEKAYKEGKISKETYEKNLAKFKKKE